MNTLSPGTRLVFGRNSFLNILPQLAALLPQGAVGFDGRLNNSSANRSKLRTEVQP